MALNSTIDATDSVGTTISHALIFMSINVVSLVAIVTVNTLTLVAIATTPKLQTIPYMYVASLSVSDLLVGVSVFSGLFWLHPATHGFFQESWFLCLGSKWVIFLTESSSVVSLVLIATDRFIYIKHPFFYARAVTTTRVKVMIASAFLFCVILTILGRLIIGLSEGSDVDRGCGVYFMLYESTASSRFIGGLFLAVCVSLFVLYGIVLKIAVKQARSVEALHYAVNNSTIATISSSNQRVRKARLSLKAVKRMAGVFIVLFVCWLPFVTVGFMEPSSVSDDVILTFAVLAIFNSTANFFVYGLTDRDLRNTIWKIIRKICCCKETTRNSASFGV